MVVKQIVFLVTPECRELHLRGNIYISYVITHNKNVTPHQQNIISNSNIIYFLILSFSRVGGSYLIFVNFGGPAPLSDSSLSSSSSVSLLCLAFRFHFFQLLVHRHQFVSNHILERSFFFNRIPWWSSNSSDKVDAIFFFPS